MYLSLGEYNKICMVTFFPEILFQGILFAKIIRKKHGNCFLVGRILMTASISLGVMGLFRSFL